MPAVYPPVAREAGVTGTVVMHAIIDETGRVVSLTYIAGPKMLTGAALEAARQWRYQPYLLNGVPVSVDTTVSVTMP